MHLQSFLAILVCDFQACVEEIIVFILLNLFLGGIFVEELPLEDLHTLLIVHIERILLLCLLLLLILLEAVLL